MSQMNKKKKCWTQAGYKVIHKPVLAVSVDIRDDNPTF